MVERRHHGHAFFGDQFVDFGLRIVLALTDNADFRTQRLDAIDLVLGNQRRHADDAARPRLLRRIGQTAPVVACGSPGDAALPLFPGQGQHRIGRAAQLEAAGDLVVLELEVHRGAGKLGEWASGVGRMRPLIRALARWMASIGIIAAGLAV